jgi:2-dehydro-3-deoxygluconokinase
MSRTNEFEVVTFGETMLVLVPAQRGPLESVSMFESFVAGAETNTAIGLSRLGHHVAWVSRLGDEPIGRRVIKTVRGEGVDVSRVELGAGETTGLLIKEPLPGGSSRAHYYRRESAASRLRWQQFEDLQAKLLFVTGITPALSVSNRDLTGQVVEHFRNRGARVIFDPNMRYKLWPAERARKVLLELAALSDVVVPGLDEAEMLTGQTDFEPIAQHFLAIGAKSVVIKAGADGAYVHDGRSGGHIAPIPVSAVDSVGAGDAFCAGLISGLADGLSITEAARRGAALGALCVGSFGDWSGLPTRSELETFLRGSADPER